MSFFLSLFQPPSQTRESVTCDFDCGDPSSSFFLDLSTFTQCILYSFSFSSNRPFATSLQCSAYCVVRGRVHYSS